MRHMPPFQAIEAFAVAARSKSFREAADRLALSPSATLRRIQSLEAHIGQPLFERKTQPLMLTEAGARYLVSIEPAVAALIEATAAARGPQSRPALRLAVSESLAGNWLMPRLERLRRETEAEIELVIEAGPDAVLSGRADAAVYACTRQTHGLPAERLIDFEGVVLAAPVPTGGWARPRNLDEAARCPKVEVKTPPRSWQCWLERFGHADRGPPPMRFATLTLTYESAANGFGLALGAPVAADRYVSDGRLTRCLEAKAPLDAGYSFVSRDAALAGRTDVRRVRDWLHAEMQASRVNFERLTEAA